MCWMEGKSWKAGLTMNCSAAREPMPTCLKRRPSTIDSTAELILCCARARRDPDSVKQIRDLVRAGIDWNRVMEIALRNTMVPLLYDGLRLAGPDAVPSETLRQIRTHFQNNSWRN